MDSEEYQWAVEWTLDIDKVRSLYDSISYAYESWPGYPKRPLEEQEFLKATKSELFAMMMDHNLYKNS